MHVLCVTGINYCDGVTINAVCKIPFVCIGHVVTFPTFSRGFTPKKCAFYLEHRVNSIINILMHQSSYVVQS